MSGYLEFKRVRSMSVILARPRVRLNGKEMSLFKTLKCLIAWKQGENLESRHHPLFTSRLSTFLNLEIEVIRPRLNQLPHRSFEFNKNLIKLLKREKYIQLLLKIVIVSE